MASDDRFLDLLGVLIAFGLVAGLAILVFASGSSPPVSQDTESVPTANWTTERVNATHVQLAHVGGEAVASEDLALTVDGEERPVPWSGEVEREVGLVRADEGSEVELFWTGADEGRVSLGRWTP